MVAVPKQRRRVVFVDPSDGDAATAHPPPFWWPAMVVPDRDIPRFRATMLEPAHPWHMPRRPVSGVASSGDMELLVCYFEDGSFSIVKERDCIPFDPRTPPYTAYLAGDGRERFCADVGMRNATFYWETGIPPQSFLWLYPKVVGADAAKAVAMGRSKGRRRGRTVSQDAAMPDESAPAINGIGGDAATVTTGELVSGTQARSKQKHARRNSSAAQARGHQAAPHASNVPVVGSCGRCFAHAVLVAPILTCRHCLVKPISNEHDEDEAVRVRAVELGDEIVSASIWYLGPR